MHLIEDGMAPGEQNHPIGLYLDKHAEEKSFPVLFAGKRRNASRQSYVRYSTICKAELRNIDRRFATSVPNIFFKLKKLLPEQTERVVCTYSTAGKTNFFRHLLCS